MRAKSAEVDEISEVRGRRLAIEAGVPVIHALRGWVAKQGKVLNLLNLSVAVSFTKWPLFECKFPMRIIFR